MAAAAGVLLDAVDLLRAGLAAVEVDCSDATSRAATAVSHGYAPGVVAPAFGHALFVESKREVGAVFPEVVFHGAFQMAEAGGARLVRAPASVGLALEGGWVLEG